MLKLQSLISHHKKRYLTNTTILCLLALGKLLLHFATNGQYGYHLDELYYLSAGEHLAWGYTEFPPLVAIIANLSRFLLGDSLFAIRLFPAIAGALLVIITGLITSELGGKRFAQIIAAIATIVAPYYLWMNTILTMNAFEPLIWTICGYLIILLIKYQYPKLWLLIGFVVGIGLETKYTIIFFACSIITAWVLRGDRKLLFNQWMFLGCLIALIIFLPNLIWQFKHGLPFLEHQRAANLYDKKAALASIIDLCIQPLLYMNPLCCPLWLAGLYFYLKTKAGKPYQILGWGYIILFGLYLLLKAKYYYLAPIYPILIAAGAVVIEQLTQNFYKLKRAIIIVILLGTTVMLPMVLPVLPMQTLLQISYLYSSLYTLPNARGDNTLNNLQAPLHFRQMLGWEELVSQVAQVYHQLPSDQQQATAILAWDYAEAGAIDLYAEKYNIPKVISGAHGFYFWGTRNYTGNMMISIGNDTAYLQQLFNQVEQVAKVTNEQTLGLKTNIPIYLCRGLKFPLKENWYRFKAYFKQVYIGNL